MPFTFKHFTERSFQDVADLCDGQITRMRLCQIEGNVVARVVDALRASGWDCEQVRRPGVVEYLSDVMGAMVTTGSLPPMTMDQAVGAIVGRPVPKRTVKRRRAVKRWVDRLDVVTGAVLGSYVNIADAARALNVSGGYVSKSAQLNVPLKYRGTVYLFRYRDPGGDRRPTIANP